MIQFIDFINNNDRIIKILCKMRAKLADSQHKKHILNGLFYGFPIDNHHQSDLQSLLPPRRQWLSLYEQNRYKIYNLNSNTIYKQKITSFETNIMRLQKTIASASKNQIDQIWYHNLQTFIKDVQNSCIDPNYRLTTPITYPISKNKRTDGTEECRPISVFQSLKDKVIISLANQYLTTLFDPFFYQESLAFRAPRTYHQHSNYFTTHHDAIDRILEYLQQHNNERIFIAECDIQKFYDSVSHHIIKHEFRKLILQAHKRTPNLNTEIVERIFYSYLQCYSFPMQVYKLNNDKTYWAQQQNIKKGRFEWIEDQLIEHNLCKSKRSIPHLKIGIPQGGALSGLISNIVLNAVDKVVNKTDGHFLYLRYCDDMILMHTDNIACENILTQYEEALGKLRLRQLYTSLK